MAKILPIEVIAEKIAKQALDEYEYKGKTIREWIDVLANTEGLLDVRENVRGKEEEEIKRWQERST